MDSEIGKVMIIDDTPENLRILSQMLAGNGYRVFTFPSGKLALNAATKNPPDIILLDIKMPEMDGYEVCRHLKADAKLRDIPVLFLSAMSASMDKVAAFQAGGVDYIAKPFELEEVMARISTHLTIAHQRRWLKENCDRLNELEKLRDSLTHMIVHDMRSPLTGLIGFLNVMATQKTQFPPEELAKMVDNCQQCADSLMDMINSLLDVHRLEQGKMPIHVESCDVRQLANEGIKSLGHLAEERDIKIVAPPQSMPATCDPELMRRVVANLVANAIKFTPRDGKIMVKLDRDRTNLKLAVVDNGFGIPPEYQAKIFDKFEQVAARQANANPSTGLGLTFCKLAVEAQGGKIGVESVPNSGSTFWVNLPSR